jgi:hypothetical protein
MVEIDSSQQKRMKGERGRMTEGVLKTMFNVYSLVSRSKFQVVRSQ